MLRFKYYVGSFYECIKMGRNLKLRKLPMFKKIDIKNIVAGIIFIIIGMDLYRSGPVELWGFPVHSNTGILISLFGLCVTLVAILRRKGYQKFQTSKFRCSGCGEEYHKKNFAEHICPKCSGRLVEHESTNDKHNSH